jgi:hypothetical protein
MLSKLKNNNRLKNQLTINIILMNIKTKLKFLKKMYNCQLYLKANLMHIKMLRTHFMIRLIMQENNIKLALAQAKLLMKADLYSKDSLTSNIIQLV